MHAYACSKNRNQEIRSQTVFVCRRKNDDRLTNSELNDDFKIENISFGKIPSLQLLLFALYLTLHNIVCIHKMCIFSLSLSKA